MRVNILRDIDNKPSIVEITRNNRKVKVSLDNEGLLFEGQQNLFPSIAEILQMDYPFSVAAASRLSGYDRNPVSKTYDRWGSNVEHAPTLRASYVCPSYKKAVIESLLCKVIRITAATSASRAAAYCQYAPSGQDPSYLDVIALAHIFTNNVGDGDADRISGVFLYPGDTIKLWTSDVSTGGTCNYLTSYKITEFDA